MLGDVEPVVVVPDACHRATPGDTNAFILLGTELWGRFFSVVAVFRARYFLMCFVGAHPSGNRDPIQRGTG